MSRAPATAADGSDSLATVAVSGPITIAAAASGAASTLVPTLTRTTLAASVIAGKSTASTATISLQNSGSTVYSGSTHVTLYLSLSSTLDSTATGVSDVVRNVRIPAHKSVPVVVRLGAVPAVANAVTPTPIAPLKGAPPSSNRGRLARAVAPAAIKPEVSAPRVTTRASTSALPPAPACARPPTALERRSWRRRSW